MEGMRNAGLGALFGAGTVAVTFAGFFILGGMGPENELVIIAGASGIAGVVGGTILGLLAGWAPGGALARLLALAGGAALVIPLVHLATMAAFYGDDAFLLTMVGAVLAAPAAAVALVVLERVTRPEPRL